MYNINESDEFPQDSSYSVQRARQFYENMNNTNQGYDQSMSVPSRRRTAPARTYSPRTDIQFSDLALSERPSVLNHSHEVEMYNASRIPLSYNLRKNIPPEYSNSHMVAQYYPGSPNGYQQQGYRIPRASSPRNDYMYTNPLPPHELSTTSSEVPQQQYDRTMIGATSGTVVAILETDILDSSTDEDDVIKECENETVDNDIEYENEGGASSSDELDDPEVLALFEREQIVDKYEKGPEQAGIDPWENPNFELYEKTDRFGFIHKEGLTKQEIERKEQIKERKRCLKWDAMYKEWEHREPTKMRERIWKGIPESYRIRAWSKMLHIEEYKNGNEKVYQELLVRGQLLSKEVKQIDLDVNRTYRDNVAFMKRYDISQKRLFQILTAYSMYNTEVGYCQGMNHIVALLIMYMSDDEDAFWGLHSLLANKKYTMHGFFVPSFPKLRKFEDHFLNRVLPKYAPKVHKHFEKLMLPPIYLPKWWFGCFLDRVPFKLVLRIWDVFLFLGDGVLMAMALNIFKMHEKKVIRMSMEQFMDFIQRGLPADFGYTDDQVMESLKRWLEKLQDDKMALPPRKEDDFPNQPLGPVLKRSLVDIRMDIAEIHSRSSRANSLAGRSPAPLRSRRSQKPNEKASLSQSVTALPTPNAQAFKNTASESDPRPLRPSGTPPIDGFRRKPSVRNGRTAAPLPIPDADGFVPLSATKNRHSLYDNVTPSTTPSSGSRLPAHSRETSSDRVHRAANNVTYIQLTDDDRVPSPPPDYDTDDLR